MGQIYQYTRGMSNGFFIVDKGIIAVDCGSQLGKDHFLSACEECGIDPHAIKLIIVTHGHVDHYVNIANMKRESKAPVLCHMKAETFLANGLYPNVVPRCTEAIDPEKTMERSERVEPCPVIEKVQPDIVIDDEFDLSPYGVSGKIICTPGHSEGCLSIVLDWHEAIIGDILMMSPVTKKPIITVFGYCDNLKKVNGELFCSAEAVLKQAERFYSGHGGPYTKEQFLNALNEAKQEAKETGRI